VTVPAHAPARLDHALGTLFKELSPHLLRYAEGILGNRADAEEAVQDAFVAAAGAGSLDAPRPWLFRVTRNAAVDQLRRRRHLTLLDADGGVSQRAPGPTPHERAELAHDMGLLRAGIDRLGEQQRSALMLRELAGLGYAEIASVLEVSEANVKVLIFRARRSLDEFARAARLPCETAQLVLSARADGEAGIGEAACARLHAVTCAHCRAFASAIGDQRIGLALMVPLVPLTGGVAVAALHGAAAAGAKAGGGLGGLFGLKATAATVATVAVISTGAVVAEREGVLPIAHHPPALTHHQPAGKRSLRFSGTGNGNGASAATEGSGGGPEGDGRTGGDAGSADGGSGDGGSGDSGSRSGDSTTTAVGDGGGDGGYSGGDSPQARDN
jgi:RNA polymerase sigma factor (sigma-70 family)